MLKNRNLLIVALIVTVNTLGYGIIIPVIFSYSQNFGLSVFENGLLFSIFSVCQFISTPIIGRASDKYGRKPLLVISVAGTALSFFMMAFAPSALFLFIARALDGITAGNIPVASAVISDSTQPHERAKGFGIISGAFNFGFIFGPLISAMTVGYAMELPFIIAGVITVIAVLLTITMLPETNKTLGQVKKEKLFDFPRLARELFSEKIGSILLITLIYSTAFGMFIYAFQPFSIDVLKLTTTEISSIFVVFGVIGLIMQFFGISYVTKKFGERNVYIYSFLFVSVAFALMFGVTTLIPFILISAFLSMANAAVFPLSQTILSKSAEATEQGSVQGINASYMSIGQILGPLLAGAVATISISYPFLAGAVLVLFAHLVSRKIFAKQL